MSTYTQILYQLVFSTFERKPVLTSNNRRTLFAYLNGILKQKNCHVYRINGVEDHLHIIFELHPQVALADLVKQLKIATSILIKEENLFPGFTAWQEGYAAFTYSLDAKNRLIEYVKNQEEHHKSISFRDEYRDLLKEHGVSYDEKYLP